MQLSFHRTTSDRKFFIFPASTCLILWFLPMLPSRSAPRSKLALQIRTYGPKLPFYHKIWCLFTCPLKESENILCEREMFQQLCWVMTLMLTFDLDLDVEQGYLPSLWGQGQRSIFRSLPSKVVSSSYKMFSRSSELFATHCMISTSASNQTVLAFCLNESIYQSRRVFNDLLVKQYFCILSNNLINNSTIFFFSTLVLLSYNSANK